MAFFMMDDDDSKEPLKGFKALKQSDKTALSSVSAVLRLPSEDGEATGLRKNLVDFLDKATLEKRKAKR